MSFNPGSKRSRGNSNDSNRKIQKPAASDVQSAATKSKPEMSPPASLKIASAISKLTADTIFKAWDMHDADNEGLYPRDVREILIFQEREDNGVVKMHRNWLTARDLSSTEIAAMTYDGVQLGKKEKAPKSTKKQVIKTVQTLEDIARIVGQSPDFSRRLAELRVDYITATVIYFSKDENDKVGDLEKTFPRIFATFETLCSEIRGRKQLPQQLPKLTAPAATVMTVPGSPIKASSSIVDPAPISISDFQISADSVIAAEEISGNEEAKRALTEGAPTLALPHLRGMKHMYSGSVLLFGCPGTGKTLLASSVAKTGISFFSIDAAKILDKLMGGSERNIDKIFADADKFSPCVIFIDEIQSVGGIQPATAHEASRLLVTQLCICMSKYPKVFVIGATTVPWLLDPAIERRLISVHVRLPNNDAREHLFRAELNGVHHSCTDADFSQMANESDGFTGAIISQLVGVQARRAAFRIVEAQYFSWVIFEGRKGWMPAEDGTPADQVAMDKTIPPPLAINDILSAIEERKGRVKALKEDEAKYAAWGQVPFQETK